MELIPLCTASMRTVEVSADRLLYCGFLTNIISWSELCTWLILVLAVIGLNLVIQSFISGYFV